MTGSSCKVQQRQSSSFLSFIFVRNETLIGMTPQGGLRLLQQVLQLLVHLG